MDRTIDVMWPEGSITELKHIQWIWQNVWIVHSRHGPHNPWNRRGNSGGSLFFNGSRKTIGDWPSGSWVNPCCIHNKYSAGCWFLLCCLRNVDKTPVSSCSSCLAAPARPQFQPRPFSSPLRLHTLALYSALYNTFLGLYLVLSQWPTANH